MSGPMHPETTRNCHTDQKKSSRTDSFAALDYAIELTWSLVTLATFPLIFILNSQSRVDKLFNLTTSHMTNRSR
jgi:hypothetical protein